MDVFELLLVHLIQKGLSAVFMKLCIIFLKTRLEIILSTSELCRQFLNFHVFVHCITNSTAPSVLECLIKCLNEHNPKSQGGYQNSEQHQ